MQHPEQTETSFTFTKSVALTAAKITLESVFTFLTVPASVALCSCRTVACIVCNEVNALAVVSAWQRVAFVDLLLAILACVALFADACVLVHIVVTEGIVTALVLDTVVNVQLTICPVEALLAVALEAVQPVHTCSTVLTLIHCTSNGLAFVHIHCACCSLRNEKQTKTMYNF